MKNILKFFRSKALYLVISLYIAYLVIIFALLANNLSSLIGPLIAPMTLVVGIFIWKWQEDQKNKTARNEEHFKKCRERAEKLFNAYIKYESSIQRLHRVYTDFCRCSDDVKKFNFLSDIGKEITLNKSLQDDVYFESVLYYFLIEKKSKLEVYQDATTLNNHFTGFWYFVDNLEKLVDAYNDCKGSESEKRNACKLKLFNISGNIKNLDFGYSEDRNKVIYTKPREKIINTCGEYFV